MMERSGVGSVALVTLLLCGAAVARTDSTGEEAEPAWSFGASLSWYFVHDATNFGVPTATADHGPVQLRSLADGLGVRGVEL